MQSTLRNSQMGGDRAGGEGTGLPGLLGTRFQEYVSLYHQPGLLAGPQLSFSALLHLMRSPTCPMDRARRYCTHVHPMSRINVITGQRMTRTQWAEQVDDMVSRGAVGTDQDIKQVVDYLAANFPRQKAGASENAVASASSPTPASEETPQRRPKRLQPLQALSALGKVPRRG